MEDQLLLPLLGYVLGPIRELTFTYVYNAKRDRPISILTSVLNSHMILQC